MTAVRRRVGIVVPLVLASAAASTGWQRAAQIVDASGVWLVPERGGYELVVEESADTRLVTGVRPACACLVLAGSVAFPAAIPDGGKAVYRLDYDAAHRDPTSEPGVLVGLAGAGGQREIYVLGR
jgi:hypothetical protein